MKAKIINDFKAQTTTNDYFTGSTGGDKQTAPPERVKFDCVPKVCWQFSRKTIHCFSHPFAGNEIHITVYQEAIDELRKRLKNAGKRSPASFNNTIRLYVWLRLLNIIGLSHMSQLSMAEMLFSGREERLKKSLCDLEELGLVKSTLLSNNKTGRDYYKYCAYPIDINITNRSNTLPYEYKTTELKKLSEAKHVYLDEAWLDVNQKCPDEFQSNFMTTFIGFYDELEGLGDVHRRGFFSKKDGRFYHSVHQAKKDFRASSVMWDNEHISEVWDANASFFLVLGYLLREKAKNGEIKSKTKILNETERMLNLCLNGLFYDDVQDFYSQRTGEQHSRNYIKFLCQKYRTRWRSYFFRKDGGYINRDYVQPLKYIDGYFEFYFPTIRNYILDYRTEMVENEHYGDVFISKTGVEYTSLQKEKRMSMLQREVMPKEFELISMGVCRRLYEDYGIKSVSIHDAIYVKESDRQRCPDIDDMLREVLDVPMPKPAFPPGQPARPASHPTLYHLNLNTPVLPPPCAFSFAAV